MGDESGIEEAKFLLDEWLDGPMAGPWDAIINLSFSPSSSYLTDLLARENTKTTGYRRQSDGFLAIPDDASAYFYAQVGPGKHNRIHLVDLFAMVADVELTDEDWRVEGLPPPTARSGVIMHLGASQSEKRLAIDTWREVVEAVTRMESVFLVGSADERVLSEKLAGIPGVTDLVGKTRLFDLFATLQSARLLVGADSAPIHMAALVNTPVLNLSFDSVSYWETGPLSVDGFVLHAKAASDLRAPAITEAIGGILSGRQLPAIRRVPGPGPRFASSNPKANEFSWQLIQSLYMQADFPVLKEDSVTALAVQRLVETCELAEKQMIELQNNPQSREAVQILSAVDQILCQIPRLAPTLSPLIRWFETERLRLPPASMTVTLTKTRALFSDLFAICEALRQQPEPDLVGLRVEGLTRLDRMMEFVDPCSRAFRFHKLSTAEPLLESLLDHLSFFENHGLHHADGTNVEAVDKWTRAYDRYRLFLSRMIQAFEKRDYVLVADILEYDFPVCFAEWRSQLVKWRADVLP